MTGEHGFDGRWLSALIVAGYFLFLFAGSSLTHLSLSRFWNELGVAAAPTRFLDLEAMVASTETLREGGNPWIDNPHDPLHRPFNYPRIWLYSDYFGLNRHTLFAFGCGFALIYFAAALFALGKLSPMEGLFAGSFLVAPATIYAVERGSIDQVTFALLALALAWRRFPAVSNLAIIFATFLKIYPAFALLAEIRPPWRKTAPFLVLSVAILFFCLIAFSSDLAHIVAGVPHGPQFSFGSATIPLWFHRNFNHESVIFLDSTTLLLSDGVLVLVIVLAALFLPRIPLLNGADDPERPIFAFRMGLGIFLGTFAFGSAWDYRFLFLLFCLPLLFRLARQENASAPARIILALIFVYANWYLFSNESEYRHFFLKQAVAWALVAGLISVLISTGFRADKPLPDES